MGENQSKESDQVIRDLEKLYCSIGLEKLPRKDFQVLKCGHYFCKECLEAWCDQKIMQCPVCRLGEERGLCYLDNPDNFKGKLLFQNPPEQEEAIDIEKMIHKQMIRRANTVR